MKTATFERKMVQELHQVETDVIIKVRVALQRYLMYRLHVFCLQKRADSNHNGL